MENLTPAEKVAATVLTYYRLLETAPSTALELATWLEELTSSDLA